MVFIVPRKPVHQRSNRTVDEHWTLTTCCCLRILGLMLRIGTLVTLRLRASRPCLTLPRASQVLNLLTIRSHALSSRVDTMPWRYNSILNQR